MARKHQFSFKYSNASILMLCLFLILAGFILISANSIISAEIADDTPTPTTPNETNSSPLAETDDFISKKLIVYTNDSYAIQNINATITPLINSFYILEFDTIDAAKNAYYDLRNNPAIIDVVADTSLNLSSVPNNRVAYGVRNIGADDYKAWLNLNSYNTTVKVAVIDSGVNLNHEAFNNPSRIVTTAYTKNYHDNNTDLSDAVTEGGHGTGVAGVIAESTPSNVKIYPYKVFGQDGTISINGSILTSSLFSAISNAASIDKADIINLSLTLNGENDELVECSDNTLYESFFEALTNNYNVFIVAAAGNNSRNNAEFPANCQNVVGVSSVDNNYSFSTSFSNYGPGVNFAMPGENLVLPSNEGVSSYVLTSGTSFSAPFLSAAAALVKTEYPNYTPSQIYTKLEESAISMTNSAQYNVGHGIVDFNETYLAKPRVLVSSSNTNWVEEDTVTIKAFSSKNLVARGAYLGNDSSSLTWNNISDTPKTETTTQRITKNGTYHFYYRNNRGETNSADFTESHIDNTPPYIVGEPSAVNIGPNSAKIKFTFKDDQSGIQTVKYYIKKASASSFTLAESAAYGSDANSQTINANSLLKDLDPDTEYSYYAIATDWLNHAYTTNTRSFKTALAGTTPANDEPDIDTPIIDNAPETTTASTTPAIQPEAVKTSTNTAAPKTDDTVTTSITVLSISGSAAILVYYLASRRRR